MADQSFVLGEILRELDSALAELGPPRGVELYWNGGSALEVSARIRRAKALLQRFGMEAPRG